MKLNCTGKVIVPEENSNLSKLELFESLEDRLKSRGLPIIERTEDSLYFYKKIQFTDHTGYNRWQIIHILRRGNIKITNSENRLIIKYFVSQSFLILPLLFLIPILTLFLSTFADKIFIESLFISVALLSIGYLLGIFYLKTVMDSLIYDCFRK